MSEVICPHCKNPVYDEDALLCHFCGNSLSRGSSGVFGVMRGGGMRWVWVAIVLIIAVVMIATMFL